MALPSATNRSTRSRLYRSPSNAANGVARAAGNIRMSPTKPTANAPPASYAKTPRATRYAVSLATELAYANSTRRRRLLRETAANARTSSVNRRQERLMLRASRRRFDFARQPARLSDSGRYWARTSDPQLVDSRQAFALVRACSAKPHGKAEFRTSSE